MSISLISVFASNDPVDLTWVIQQQNTMTAPFQQEFDLAKAADSGSLQQLDAVIYKKNTKKTPIRRVCIGLPNDIAEIAMVSVQK